MIHRENEVIYVIHREDEVKFISTGGVVDWVVFAGLVFAIQVGIVVHYEVKAVGKKILWPGLDILIQ